MISIPALQMFHVLRCPYSLQYKKSVAPCIEPKEKTFTRSVER